MDVQRKHIFRVMAANAGATDVQYPRLDGCWCLRRFSNSNRLEARHWVVLEQDRVMLESMEPEANQREHLYEHDVGVSRLRRHKQSLAQKQLAAVAAQPGQAAIPPRKADAPSAAVA